MINGINGKTYYDLEKYLDMSKFDQVQSEIVCGFASAREFAKEGTWMTPGFTFDNMSYRIRDRKSVV
jgi:hypothetical protein